MRCDRVDGSDCSEESETLITRFDNRGMDPLGNMSDYQLLGDAFGEIPSSCSFVCLFDRLSVTVFSFPSSSTPFLFLPFHQDTDTVLLLDSQVNLEVLQSVHPKGRLEVP